MFSGELRWGVKARFRDYLAQLDDGVERRMGEVSDDAGPFTFPLASATDFVADVPVGELWFVGAVHFVGHGGFLNVTVSDPCLRLTATGAVLSVDSAPRGVRERRIDFAHSALGAAEGLTRGSWIVRDLILTPVGAELLGGVYASGEPADDASFWIEDEA